MVHDIEVGKNWVMPDKTEGSMIKIVENVTRYLVPGIASKP